MQGVSRVKTCSIYFIEDGRGPCRSLSLAGQSICVASGE